MKEQNERERTSGSIIKADLYLVKTLHWNHDVSQNHDFRSKDGKLSDFEHFQPLQYNVLEYQIIKIFID